MTPSLEAQRAARDLQLHWQEIQQAKEELAEYWKTSQYSHTGNLLAILEREEGVEST